MTKEIIDQGFVPYSEFFPKSKKGWEELSLLEKCGKAKPGPYLFLETYCTIGDCDCRQVVLHVFNKKQRTVAVIDFFLDIDVPFLRPCLNSSVKQSAAAADLLEIFLEALVDTPDWYRGMCQRYRAVRRKINNVPYQGKRFPNKRYLQYLSASADADEDEAIDTLMRDLDLFFPEEQGRKRRQPVEPYQGNLFEEENGDLIAFVDVYRGNAGKYGLSAYEDERLRELLKNDRYVEEFITYLVRCYNSEDSDSLDAALLLLSGVMDILRTDIERRRPQANKKMEFWQNSLARQIFTRGVAIELGAEVTQVLLNTRIEILPQLHQANTTRLFEMVPPENSIVAPDPGSAIEPLMASIAEIGIDSAFEMVDALLQMMAIGNTEVQLAMYEVMFCSETIMAREAAMLMLFHPREEVRARVAEFLAEADGSLFTPVILRRLIVTRNWFPETLRQKLDQAIANARRARIECAPLNGSEKVQAYASSIDGAHAQTLQIIIPLNQQGYRCCSMMAKKGSGLADSFVLELEDKKHLQEFLEMLTFETGSCAVGMSYIDQRICQALADGSCCGKVPNHWLVAIAEQLGRDQWKAVPFDIDREIEALGSAVGKGKLSVKSAKKALRASSHWPRTEAFACSWFEDDCELDRTLDRLLIKGDIDDFQISINLVVNEILESRRDEWLERLVLTAIWLKAAQRPPVPWKQVYYVAAAVADIKVPLTEIPLMQAIAENSVLAYLDRHRGAVK